MTESDWDRCTDPMAMLEFLRGRASERKLRLFACACCRRSGDLLADGPCRQAVETAEHYADGAASAEELRQAAGAVRVEDSVLTLRRFTVAARACAGADPPAGFLSHVAAALARQTPAARAAVDAARYTAYHPADLRYRAAWADALAALTAARQDLDPARRPAGCAPGCRVACARPYARLCGVSVGCERAAAKAWGETVAAERGAQAALLRDLFAGPPRWPARDPARTAWSPRAVVRLAQSVYEERSLPSGRLDAGRLAVLADMLEEAGATDAELLSHLRGPGPHVRGCHSVDAVLGRG